MNCTTGSRPSGSGLNPRVSEFLSNTQPGSSWIDDPSPEYAGRRPSGGNKSQPSKAAGALPSSEVSLTSLAVRRRKQDDDERSEQSVVATNLTRVQASKSSAKIILDDHQTGYLAVVPPDIERDLMKYTTPARDGTIGPRPIKASMLFEFDYRPKISSLLPHESHKEISAHLNIAWKSIGQDILQLYKDLAKKVEQKLKVLNGEISQVSQRAVSKRKSGAVNSRTSRDPPANSGLRRCNCRPDCAKYKIIPGSDLEKRWQARFNRRGEKSGVLNSTESNFDTDLPSSGFHSGATSGSNVTPQSASGLLLFGGSHSISQGVAPQNQRQSRPEEADELPDAFLADNSFQSSVATSQQQARMTHQQQQQQQQQHHAMYGNVASPSSAPRPGEAVPSSPLDIAQAAAFAANVDPRQNAVYYTMPQMDQQQQQIQLQQQLHQQQQHIYNPNPAAGFQSSLPYIDPHNQEQMAQLQGSYIYPNGIIVNAYGEEIARTLPPSEFANLDAAAAAPPAADNVESVDHEAPATPATPAASEAAAGSEIDPTDSDVASGYECVPSALGYSDVANVVSEDIPITSGQSSNAVEAEIGMSENVGAGQVVGGVEDDFASNVASPSSSVAESADVGAVDGPFPVSLHTAAAVTSSATIPVAPPVGPPVGVDSEAPTSHDGEVASEEQPTFVWHQVQDTPGRTSLVSSDQETSAFSWHQVQAAEGREVPAQEIGWSWKKNGKEASSNQSEASSLNGDKKDEKKEKAFALQANFTGIETESTEFAEIKMANGVGEENEAAATPPPRPPLDPRQDLEVEEVEEKAELKALRSEQGEEEEEEEDEEMPVDDEEEDDLEEGEIVDEKENECQEQMSNDAFPAVECASSVDVGIHNLTASDFDDGVGDPTTSQAGMKDFLNDSRNAE